MSNLVDIITWVAAGGLMAPLAQIGRQFHAADAIGRAPRHPQNARFRVSMARDLALTPLANQPGDDVAESSDRWEATAIPAGALRSNRLSMRWQEGSDGTLGMVWTQAGQSDR
jgi:hypothetical protein